LTPYTLYNHAVCPDFDLSISGSIRCLDHTVEIQVVDTATLAVCTRMVMTIHPRADVRVIFQQRNQCRSLRRDVRSARREDRIVAEHDNILTRCHGGIETITQPGKLALTVYPVTGIISVDNKEAP